uniref:uncharacterized protein LOC120336388 n=1 Tax=Styela clava TaxID=7725 RepID=UPI0019397C7B|nr:uncharacterized protein LOC120336388 [Styela clava]
MKTIFGNRTVTTNQMLNNGSWNSNVSATNHTFMDMNSTVAPSPTFNFSREGSNDYVVNITLALSQAVMAILFLLSCWMLASFVVYCIHNGKWKNKQTTSFFTAKLLYIIYTLVLSVIIQKLLFTQVSIQAPRGANSSSLCNAVDAVSKVYYSIITYLVYFFLWVRQRIIYEKSISSGNYISCLSWGIFALLPSEMILVIIKLIMFDDQRPVPQGCLTTDNIDNGVLRAVGRIPLIVAQIALLGMFVYAVVKNTMEYKSKYHGSKWIQLLCDTGNSKSSEVQKAIRRALIWAFVAVITDVIIGGINLRLTPENFPVSIRVTMGDMMSFVNVICIFMTFKDRWQILRIFLRRKQNKVSAFDLSTKPATISQTKPFYFNTNRRIGPYCEETV